MQKRLSFIWDYQITGYEAKTILNGPDGYEKDWLITRILENAPWDQIWNYLNLSTLHDHLDHLPLKPETKKLWQYAIKKWESTTNQAS